MVQLEVSTVDVVIKDGKITTTIPAKLERKEGKVTISGRSGSSVTILDNNGNVHMRVGNMHASSVIFGGNASFVSSNGASFISAGPGQKIIINGKVIDPSVYQSGTSTAQEEDPDFKVLDEAIDDIFDVIVVNGNSSVTVSSNLSIDLTISISGNGAVRVDDRHLQTLTCNVTGNGRVSFKNSKVDRIHANVVGNGSVKGEVVTGSGAVSVVGNGSIKIDATNPKAISKSVVGNGRARIKQA